MRKMVCCQALGVRGRANTVLKSWHCTHFAVSIRRPIMSPFFDDSWSSSLLSFNPVAGSSSRTRLILDSTIVLSPSAVLSRYTSRNENGNTRATSRNVQMNKPLPRIGASRASICLKYLTMTILITSNAPIKMPKVRCMTVRAGNSI